MSHGSKQYHYCKDIFYTLAKYLLAKTFFKICYITIWLRLLAQFHLVQRPISFLSFFLNMCFTAIIKKIIICIIFLFQPLSKPIKFNISTLNYNFGHFNPLFHSKSLSISPSPEHKLKLDTCVFQLKFKNKSLLTCLALTSTRFQVS